MKRTLLLILALSAIFSVGMATDQFMPEGALAASLDGVNRPRVRPLRRRAANVAYKRRHRRMRNESLAERPMVQAVDAAGMKKLLERDPSQKARPLLVNFWATWCGPCRDEFPDLVKIDAEYRARGLDFIIISVDEVTEINRGVPQFLQEMRAQMPAYLLNTPEPEAAISAVDPTWEGNLPATFLYDAQGRIVFKHMGRINPKELREALEKVVSDK